MYYIYKIENIINHKVYIGQTTNLKQRKHNHFKMLSANAHSNPYLQNDYNEYGVDNFEVSILDTCDTLDKSLELENLYMDLYGGTNSTDIYNVRGNGEGKSNSEYRDRLNSHLDPRAFTNHKHSYDSKCKIGKSLKEAYASGSRQKQYLSRESNHFYGKHHSNETKQHLR